MYGTEEKGKQTKNTQNLRKQLETIELIHAQKPYHKAGLLNLFIKGAITADKR